MFSRFNSNKCKTQAKMCISRIKLMRNKRQIGLKMLRREVAELLKAGKQGNARIRVEAVIRENLTLQAYDIVELFLELISVRVPLMEKAKEMPPDMLEAICSIIYAGDRMSTDLPEMAVIRHILVAKYSGVYGKEFALEASSELTCRKWHVNENLVSCLVIEAPSPQEKIRVLADIAAEHGVEFDEEAAAADMVTGAVARPMAAAPFPVPAAAEAAAPYPPAYGAPPPWAAQPPAAAAAAPAVTVGPAAVGPGSLPPWAQPPSPVASADPLAPTAPGAATPTGPGWAPLQPPPAQPGDGFQGHVSSVGNWMAAKRGSPPAKGGPGGVPDGYQDASSAAEAARQYSTMAQQAADAAEQYAKSQQQGRPGAGSSGDGGGSGDGAGLGPGRFVQRSESEIQRAYDAAPGPPSKGELASAGQPSAPPAPPAVPAVPPTVGPSGANAAGGIAGAQPLGGDANELGLPSAPTPLPKPPTGGPPGQSAEDKELEELTRRFEALKRG